MDLASAPHRMAPPGTPSALLSHAFILPGSAEEAALLSQRLGVPQAGQADFVATHLLLHAAALPAALRDAAFAGVLRGGLADLPEALRKQLATVGSPLTWILCRRQCHALGADDVDN